MWTFRQELSDKNKMQLEQINKLLIEKVTLWSEGIDQQEQLLECECNLRFVSYCCQTCALHYWFTYDCRTSMNEKEPQGESKMRFLGPYKENLHLKEQLATMQAKLSKAKVICIPTLYSICLISHLHSLSRPKINCSKKSKCAWMLAYLCTVSIFSS